MNIMIRIDWLCYNLLKAKREEQSKVEGRAGRVLWYNLQGRKERKSRVTDWMSKYETIINSSYTHIIILLMNISQVPFKWVGIRTNQISLITTKFSFGKYDFTTLILRHFGASIMVAKQITFIPNFLLFRKITY